MRDVRRLGCEGVLARVPKGVRYYATVDIDGFDPSIAPGTGTPSHGGFLYYEVLEIFQGLARQGEFGQCPNLNPAAFRSLASWPAVSSLTAVSGGRTRRQVGSSNARPTVAFKAEIMS